MARKPMVTRTITTTKANVLCLNIETGEPFNKEVTLLRTFKDDKALLKQAEKVINNDKQKAVHVVYKEVLETLYGMTEENFVALAQELPPRGSNAEDEEEAETENEEYAE